MTPFIRSARHLMTPDGRRRLTWAMISAALAGLCEAAALLVMLPLITALLTGEASAGLSFTAWLWVLIGIAAAGAITATWRPISATWARATSSATPTGCSATSWPDCRSAGSPGSAPESSHA
ncbi:hypothetical protein [Brevibacterium luteolum]|uniref:hypothetical protein n=1 Tax=Brevibacterium luteolum TaxID=199591 RepID=UPI00223BF44C|nr:hypothetical protein [Brevibacterium luteolum]MCT1830423.1 hypothetical protein [Brevibacterium luteolum]